MRQNKASDCLFAKIAAALAAFVFAGTLALGQESPSQDAPGPLSPAHAGTPGPKDCTVCHDAEYEVAAEKCLTCHQEMALRISGGRGFHKDKKQNCGTCHVEHQGDRVSLVPLDIKTFDHAKTGFVLRGVHAAVGDCAACHSGPDAFVRLKTKSYLLRDSQCTGCHKSPHVGHQEDCLSCHNFESWRVEDLARS